MSILDHFPSTPVICDGAWGTELQKRGLTPGMPSDELNPLQPGPGRGSGPILCRCRQPYYPDQHFGASRISLKKYGLADKSTEINRIGAEISKRAAGDKAKVFGSIGPSGEMLMMGDIEEDELVDAFSEQAQALAEGGVDGIVIETMADLEEAKAALRAAKTTGLPVVACMVFDSGEEKDRTMMGVAATDAARALTDAGADAIGANCGVGVEAYIPVCTRLKEGTCLPLWIKANAGLPELVDGKTVYRMQPSEYAAYLPKLIEAGAVFVGGCCGTSPDFIRALTQAAAKR
jgi:5-methyltetrahydrofolate--homocysteine methyltransferase